MRYKIPYKFIKEVKTSKIRLILRIFGGSWPGLHWGIFKTDIGQAHVYSTRTTGIFVLITLVDDTKIVISPEKLDEFINNINIKRKLFGVANEKDFKILETSRVTIYSQIIAVIAIYLVLISYICLIYPSLPEIIPVHFDLNWNPNRWAHKSELFLIAGIATIFPIINTILSLKFGKYGKGMMIFLGSIFILLIILFIFIINTIFIKA
jgi:hypothetical protein